MTIGTGTSGAVPVTSPDRAIDVPISGGCIAHIALVGQVYTSIIPLSGNPFSREVFATEHAIVKLDCKGKPPNYVVEVGYQIASNFDISDGLNLGVTPQFAQQRNVLCINGATTIPQGAATCPTAQVRTGSNTTTISFPVQQKFKQGPIVEAAIQKREWKKDDTKSPVKYPPAGAAINVHNWHLVLNNAVGEIKMRGYVKLISSSSDTDDINVTYGLPVSLR
ncbi:MAG: MspA family porin [Nocardiaceae bacterium]|nr:MspA family porin [Nocardiaceae bacterium]